MKMYVIFALDGFLIVRLNFKIIQNRIVLK